MIEDDAMALQIKMDGTKPNHSGFESPPSSSPVATDDNERCHAVCDKDSHTNGNSNKSKVHNNIALEEVVCSPPKKRLKKLDEEAVIMGERLTDVKINLAQRILKSQSPSINGLHFTLFQCKPCTASDQINENKLQIIFHKG